MSHVNIKDGLSEKQVERQKNRSGGKYSKYPICELCGKTVSVDYSSDLRCNATGFGLLLHKRCYTKSDKMNNKEFIETFGKGITIDEKKKYLTRLNREFPNRN